MDIAEISDTLAESGVIATIVCHPEFILHSDYLKAGYFFGKDNGCIYWAIQELYKSGVDNIDAFNIANMISSNKEVKKTTEQYNLPSMQEYIGLSANVARNTLEEYMLLVDRVVELSFKRDLHKLMVELERDCSSKIALSDLNTKVYDKLNKLTEKYITSNNIKMFSDQVDTLWNEICNRRSEDGIYGIPSKYSILSEYFTYEPTELVLLKARMKRGKSAFFMNEALHKIKNGIPTAYLDSEMNDRLFFERVLANLTGVDVKRIKNGKYDYDEEKRLAEANEWIKKQPFVHIYDPQSTNESMYSTCKILKYKMGLQFVVYDYIKSNIISSSEQYNDLGQKCDFLKNNIAGDLNLSVFAGAQLNRNNQVADSDKLERYASVSILWRDKTSDEIIADGEECGNFAMNINLNRLGEQMAEDDYIDFNFDGNKMRIEQAEKQHIVQSPF